jgi:hypothetical protein
MGTAWRRIRDGKLWRHGVDAMGVPLYATWLDYLARRWKKSESHFSRIIDESEVVVKIHQADPTLPIGKLLDAPSVARPMIGLLGDQAAGVYKEASQNGAVTPTAGDVAAARDRHVNAGIIDPKPKGKKRKHANDRLYPREWRGRAVHGPTLLIAYKKQAGILFRVMDRESDYHQQVNFRDEYHAKYNATPEIFTFSDMDDDAIQSLKDAVEQLTNPVVVTGNQPIKS